MVKQIILLIGVSIVAVFFKNEITHALNLLVYAHNQVAGWLSLIFSNDHVGRIIQGIISLIVIPVVIGAVLAGAHWLVKKTSMPHTLTVIWVIWTILLTTLLAQAT